MIPRNAVHSGGRSSNTSTSNDAPGDLEDIHLLLSLASDLLDHSTDRIPVPVRRLMSCRGRSFRKAPALLHRITSFVPADREPPGVRRPTHLVSQIVRGQRASHPNSTRSKVLLWERVLQNDQSMAALRKTYLAWEQWSHGMIVSHETIVVQKSVRFCPATSGSTKRQSSRVPVSTQSWPGHQPVWHVPEC